MTVVYIYIYIYMYTNFGKIMEWAHLEYVFVDFCIQRKSFSVFKLENISKNQCEYIFVFYWLYFYEIKKRFKNWFERNNIYFIFPVFKVLKRKRKNSIKKTKQQQQNTYSECCHYIQSFIGLPPCWPIWHLDG